MLNIVFILMIIMAIAAIQTQVLRHAVVYLSVFSLLCSLAYLYYQAPDVAIAEAAIGCTLSTVLYLVALKKYSIFRVYYSRRPQNIPTNHVRFETEHSLLMGHMQKYLVDIELELDMINTHKSASDIERSSSYDLIVEHSEKAMTIYGSDANYHFEGIKDYLVYETNLNVDFIYIEEEEEEEE